VLAFNLVEFISPDSLEPSEAKESPDESPDLDCALILNPPILRSNTNGYFSNMKDCF
jgi:hypothetical protein